MEVGVSPEKQRGVFLLLFLSFLPPGEGEGGIMGLLITLVFSMIGFGIQLFEELEKKWDKEEEEEEVGKARMRRGEEKEYCSRWCSLSLSGLPFPFQLPILWGRM